MGLVEWLRVVAKWGGGGLVRLRGECSVGCDGVKFMRWGGVNL